MVFPISLIPKTGKTETLPLKFVALASRALRLSPLCRLADLGADASTPRAVLFP